MLIILMMMNWIFAIIAIFLSHPLSLGFMLLTQTILISLMSGYMYLNYWFSYILFLVMIGGMLVMFIYMTSVASNEKFKFSKNTLLLMVILSLFLLVSMNIDWLYSNIIPMINEILNSNKLKLSYNKFYNYPNYQLMIFLMIYLLITLIAIVKIVKKTSGSLRQK